MFCLTPQSRVVFDLVERVDKGPFRKQFLLSLWRLRRLTGKFNDPKVQYFESCRGEAFRDYFTGRKTQKVKNHGEPKLMFTVIYSNEK